MKALRTTLAAVILFIGAMTVNAQSMSIAAMRSNARFLTDRMAYTLGISDPYLIDEIYRINYDYIWGVNEYLDDVAQGYYYDEYMAVVAARDEALRALLGYNIWNRLVGYSYFYRPIVFVNRGWHFSIYDYDRYGVHRFYFGVPRPLVHYTGGHFFRPMPPRAGRVAPPSAPVHGRMAPSPGYGRRVTPPAPGRPSYGMAPRGGNVTPRNGMAPRGGNVTPRNDVAPRGGNVTPRNDVTPRGGNVTPHNDMAPHGGNVTPRNDVTPRGGGNMDRGGSTISPRSSGNMGGASRGGASMFAPRSHSNMGSSSRGGVMAPSRSSAAPVRVSNGGSRGMGGGFRGGRR